MYEEEEDDMREYEKTNILKDKTKVALAILKTGKSNPGHINKSGKTALMYACETEMREVALAILATGESNPEHVNDLGKSALMYSKENNMSDVEEEIYKATLLRFNINTDVLNIIEGEIPLEKCSELNYITFVFYDVTMKHSQKVCIPYFELEKAIQNRIEYIVYECKIKGSMSPQSVNTKEPYFDIKKLTGFGDLVPLSDIKIIHENKLSKIFIFKRGKRIDFTVSDNVLHHRTDMVSGRHCQEGQSSYIYNMVKDFILTCSERAKTAGGKLKKSYKKKLKTKKLYNRKNKTKNKKYKKQKSKKK